MYEEIQKRKIFLTFWNVIMSRVLLEYSDIG